MPSLDDDATLYNLIRRAVDAKLSRRTGSPPTPTTNLSLYLDGCAGRYLATRAEAHDS
jgi:hypothetical protein